METARPRLRAELTRHRRLVTFVAASYLGALIAAFLAGRSNAVLYGCVITALVVVFVGVHLRAVFLAGSYGRWAS